MTPLKLGEKVNVLPGCAAHKKGVREAIVSAVGETLGEFFRRTSKELGCGKRYVERLAALKAGDMRLPIVGVKVYGHPRLPEGFEIGVEPKYLRPA